MHPIIFIVLLLSSLSHAYEKKQVCSSPRIYLLDDFLSDAECDYLIAQAAPLVQRSTVLDAKAEGAIDDRRTSRGMFLQTVSPALRQIEQRIFLATQIPIENGESLQVLHYAVGGEYQPHYDYFTKDQPGGADTLKRGGQRVATLIMYLNTPAKGGETIFPRAHVSVTPKKGSAVLFYNVTLDGKDDPESFHGGSPVVEGEKWIATKWLRQGAFR